jgi:hypothetical protein
LLACTAPPLLRIVTRRSFLPLLPALLLFWRFLLPAHRRLLTLWREYDGHCGFSSSFCGFS